MKNLEIAVIILRIEALLWFASLLIILTYVPTYIIPDGQSTTMHFLESRQFFMLDIRIVIQGLTAICLWKYALPIGRFIVSNLPKDIQ
ncbi:MAG TPA: hypothetical protein VGT99_11165 [Gammaproteobacteria bacterium]|nr:hypothetical protein [Gammaproteobacteria bacterium]